MTKLKITVLVARYTLFLIRLISSVRKKNIVYCYIHKNWKVKTRRKDTNISTTSQEILPLCVITAFIAVFKYPIVFLHPEPLKYTLILPTQPRLDLLRSLIPSRLPRETFYAFHGSPISAESFADYFRYEASEITTTCRPYRMRKLKWLGKGTQ
jgi:hypothetical protein